MAVIILRTHYASFTYKNLALMRVFLDVVVEVSFATSAVWFGILASVLFGTMYVSCFFRDLGDSMGQSWLLPELHQSL